MSKAFSLAAFIICLFRIYSVIGNKQRFTFTSMQSKPNSQLALLEIKQRLYRLGMLELSEAELEEMKDVDFSPSAISTISATSTVIKIEKDDSLIEEGIQKTVPIQISEVKQMTRDEEGIFLDPSIDKRPNFGTKISSWLSSLYKPPSPTAASPTDLPSEADEILQEAIRFEISSILCKRPSKGILKEGKMPIPGPEPSPIQKSTFLKEQEAERRNLKPEKLPTRPPRLKFDLQTIYHLTFSKQQYDRAGVHYIAKSLTPEIAMLIKKELNEVKRQMPVHEDSQKYTQFYQLR